ncbi:MAG: radical SAM protein [bacterium]
MSTVALVSPNLLVQRSDRFTTGIVYMPIGLASLAATLRGAGHDVRVIDAFASAPRQVRREHGFMVLGLEPAEVAERIPDDAVGVFVYANQVVNHLAVVSILRALRERHPALPRIVVENTQAVTAYALEPVAGSLFEAGADYLLTGEPERRGLRVVAALASDRASLAQVDGVLSPSFRNEPAGFDRALDQLPFPAWDLFPVESYWRLHFAHGPLTSDRYLPILTSRGCPYPCRFCVVPKTNRRTWRPRSATSVVDEMEHFARTLGVREFHVEDLNPTIDDRRTRAICREILDRKLEVTWKIVAGTKVETLKDEETIDLMAAAGCRYVSISPESGSARVLDLIEKPFDPGHALRLVRRMNEVGIRSQACFVLGFPGETGADLEQTADLARSLTLGGLDEIALFVVAPIPGAAIFPELTGYETLSELSFSPSWRADYAALSLFRMKLYRSFLLLKLLSHPLKIVRQAINFVRRRFETKMEMAPYRALVWTALDSRF